MRIVLDLQGAQTESRYRGIGRYTLSLAKAIVRQAEEHEIILTLNGLFPDTIDPIRTVFDGLVSQENILVWQAPSPVREMDPVNTWRRLASERLRESFLASLNPDVLHVNSLFEGYLDDAVTSIGTFTNSLPTAVTIYDLIPLIYPETYLCNPIIKEYYKRKLDHMRRAHLWLAISDSSRREGIDCLGLPEEWVINISSAAGECFHPLDLPSDEKEALFHRYGITKPFVMYTGGVDQRKNLERLFNAYAKLPTTLRSSYQLVLVGKIPEGEKARLHTYTRKNDLAHTEVVYTGYVDDDELVALYNLCELFVFPSWHEGFGLPALEAMACGAPVIGANTTSLPEVIGREDAMFDPYSEDEIASKLYKVLTDSSFRFELQRHGLEQAKLFSWDLVAKRFLEAVRNVMTLKADSLTRSEQHEVSCSRYRKLIGNIAEIDSEVLPKDNDLINVAQAIASNEELSNVFKNNHKIQPVWRIEGPFDSSYSLALLNRETARALAKLGYEVQLHSTEGPGDFTPNKVFLKENSDLAEMYFRSMDKAVEIDVLSRNLYPPRVWDMMEKLSLLHHYAWEETMFPSEWVDNFNTYLSGMTCLSKHVQKVMIDNGVHIPMITSGCGVDHWERIKTIGCYPLKARSFRFLHVSSCFPRKGVDCLLEAYGRVFRQSDDVSLVIKTFQNPHNQVKEILAQMRELDNDFPDVVLIEEDLSDSDMKSLYQQCHVFVSPSRAEGFGLPMAEALLSGLPVIATGWGGQLDFLDHSWAWFVDFQFASAETHFNLFNSVWAEPEVSSLEKALLDAYSTSDAERMRMASLGREFLLNHNTWELVCNKLVSFSNSVGQLSWAVPKIGWITTWNVRCGIAAYSKHLTQAFDEKPLILAAKATCLESEDQPNVVRCWELGETDSLEELKQIIEQNSLNTIVVQFNYGFFNFSRLAEFIIEQKRCDRIVAIVLHSTTDPIHVPNKRLIDLCQVLKLCDRILVHTIKDLNRLKKIGLINNVALLPHGLPEIRTVEISGPQTKKFVISSYGFFLPHKGLIELIDAVAMLIRSGEDVVLQLVNAEYPVSESSSLIKEAKQRVVTHGLNDRVYFYSDFLPEKDSLRLLAQSDLIVFPYQKTGESSSAAVRFGIASGVPVAVTPIPIFEDVSEAVWYLPGRSTSDIADGVGYLIKLLRNSEQSPEIINWRERAEQWRDVHSYSKISKRFYGMLTGLRWSSVLDADVDYRLAKSELDLTCRAAGCIER